MMNKKIKSVSLINLQNGKPAEIPLDKEIIVGRKVNNDDIDMMIDSVHVSRRHCVFYIEDNELLIKDLNSRNGIYVNNNRIENQTILNDADIISIAHLKYQIVLRTNHVKKYLGSNMEYVISVEDEGASLSLYSNDSSQLLNYKYEMLRHNKNLNIIYPKYSVIDGISQIKYDINQLISLEDSIARKKMNILDFCRLIKTIVEIMEKSKELLINDNDFVLKTDCIFIEPNSNELKLVVNPLAHSNELKTNVVQLIETMLVSIEDDQEIFVENTKDYMKNCYIDLKEFSRYLILQTILENEAYEVPILSQGKNKKNSEIIGMSMDEGNEESIEKNSEKTINTITGKLWGPVLLQVLTLILYAIFVLRTRFSHITYFAVVILVIAIEYYLMKLYKTDYKRGESNA